MSDTRQTFPLAALAGTIAFSVYMVAQLHAQTAASAADFRNAAVAEVRDGQGQTILRGQFAVADEQDDDDVERKAALQAAGADTDAAGEAEVEFAKSAPATQEVEFSLRNLTAGMPVTFVIDGQVVGQGSVDRSGRVELELDVPMPGAPGSR